MLLKLKGKLNMKMPLDDDEINELRDHLIAQSAYNFIKDNNHNIKPLSKNDINKICENGRRNLYKKLYIMGIISDLKSMFSL